MTEDNPVLRAMDRAADALSEAASELTLVMLAAGHTPLCNDAYVLANAVDAELAAVMTTRLRYTPEHIAPLGAKAPAVNWPPSNAGSKDTDPRGAPSFIATRALLRFVITLVNVVRRGRLDG
ncbi:hypothetical protein OM076_22895 [Solirubrobacter ginsenosidimutans]|uniref:Uncharacterized protein n=1 Tax=Solirubrobacter ginsenosidimutans TaxID=490573 RepID=A0A9X3S193_9ACTN|nr:hypothetical protein [Solirubrobacter ginsenosidimutans]MDA0163140.1 hypothetical protein [Solirubrobacter ginsenosidimutans]